MASKMYEAGSVVLQSGRAIRNRKLAYKTFGTLNAKNKIIFYPLVLGAALRKRVVHWDRHCARPTVGVAVINAKRNELLSS